MSLIFPASFIVAVLLMVTPKDPCVLNSDIGNGAYQWSSEFGFREDLQLERSQYWLEEATFLPGFNAAVCSSAPCCKKNPINKKKHVLCISNPLEGSFWWGMAASEKQIWRTLHQKLSIQQIQILKSVTGKIPKTLFIAVMAEVYLGLKKKKKTTALQSLWSY